MGDAVQMWLFWAVIVALGGAITNVYFKTSQSRASIYAKLDVMRENLAAYKLEATEKYATMAHLKDVETRLVNALNALTASINTMNGTLGEMRDQITHMKARQQPSGSPAE